MSRHHHRRHHSRHRRKNNSIIPQTYTDTNYSDVENDSKNIDTADGIAAAETLDSIEDDKNIDDYNKHNFNMDSINFRENLKKFIGKPITVLIGNCSENSCSFSGILIGVNKYFIRIVTKSGNTPDPCKPDTHCDPYTLDDPCDNNSGSGNLNSIVDIPINKIVAFIHNSL